MARNQIAPKYEAFKEVIAADLAIGKPIAHIAQKCGISPDSIYDWKNKHPEFLVLIAKKRDAIQAKWVKDIEDSTQWTAKAWLLERIFREQFAPPTQKIDQTVTQRADELTDNQLEAIATKALKTADAYNTPRRGKRTSKAA